MNKCSDKQSDCSCRAKKNEPKIIEIKNPDKDIINDYAKSVLISRNPHEHPDEFKTAVLRLFDVNNPHKKNVFPIKVYIFTNIEKVRIKRLNVSYYLEGNDIVVNDLKEISIRKEGTKLTLTGYQIEIEKRTKENQ